MTHLGLTPFDPFQRSRAEAKPASSGTEKHMDGIELARPSASNHETPPMPVNPVIERAAAAGETLVKQETCIPLLDLDPNVAAEFLAPRSWRHRAEYMDHIVCDSLESLVKVMEALSDSLEGDEREFIAAAVSEMRSQITRILDRLDELCPLLPDDDAMRIFRVTNDAVRIKKAVNHWGDDEMQRLAMKPNSGLMILRNMSIVQEARLLAAPATIAGLPVRAGSSPIADLVRLYHETSQRECEARERAERAHWEIRRRFPEIPDSIKMDIGDPDPLYIPIDPKNIERRRANLVKRSLWSEAAAAQWAEETERTRSEYEAACTAIKEATEWPELDRRVDELFASMEQIEDSIIAARPQSLAELATKLRFAASQEGYTDLDEDEKGGDRGDRFFLSIIRDVEHLAGDAA